MNDTSTDEANTTELEHDDGRGAAWRADERIEQPASTSRMLESRTTDLTEAQCSESGTAPIWW
jgi:hypothetical protein